MVLYLIWIYLLFNGRRIFNGRFPLQRRVPYRRAAAAKHSVDRLGYGAYLRRRIRTYFVRYRARKKTPSKKENGFNRIIIKKIIHPKIGWIIFCFSYF